MKKTILALAILLSSLAAHAQVFPFREVNFGRYSIGFQGGVMGVGKEFTLGAFGFNVMLHGLYLDFSYNAPEHITARAFNTWNDNEGFAFHIGYQIPITEFIRVIPLVGYGEINTGVTNGYEYTFNNNYNYSYSYNNNDKAQGSNKYHKEWQHGGFDAGASIVLNLGPINFLVTGTIWGFYAGVAFEID